MISNSITKVTKNSTFQLLVNNVEGTTLQAFFGESVQTANDMMVLEKGKSYEFKSSLTVWLLSVPDANGQGADVSFNYYIIKEKESIVTTTNSSSSES